MCVYQTNFQRTVQLLINLGSAKDAIILTKIEWNSLRTNN